MNARLPPLSLWRVLPKPPAAIRDIADTVARTRGFTLEDVLSRNQRNGLREARFAVYAACRRAGFTYHQIGRRLGRDHSSVHHGARRFYEMMGAAE